MFLRLNTRKKDGQEHRYRSIGKARPLPAGKVTPRQVLRLAGAGNTPPAIRRRGEALESAIGAF